MCEKKKHFINNRLDPNMTFGNHIVGNENQLAYNVALEVSEHPGKIYNPLFIIADHGMGKTHLLHSIGNRLTDQGKSVRYITGEGYMDELIDSINNKVEVEMHNKYRCDTSVLLFDDFQFLNHREGITLDFQKTIKFLCSSGKQVVIASSSPIDDMDISDSLKSAINGGLVLSVKLPGYELRKRYLIHLMDSQNLPITSEIIEYMAKTITGSFSVLNGAVKRMKAATDSLGEEISADLVDKISINIKGNNRIETGIDDSESNMKAIEKKIKRIKSCLSISEVVSPYLRLVSGGGRHIGLCPFHHCNSYSLFVNDDAEVFFCTICGEGGGMIEFVMKIEHLTFMETVDMLARKAGMEL